MATRRINLLPPELVRRRRARQMLLAVGAAGLALVGLLALVYVFEQVRLHGARNDLEAQQQENTQLRGEVARLQEFAALERELTQKQKLLADLTTDEVRWSVVLADISLVIPSDVWLTNLTASVAVTTGSGNAAAAASLGSVTLTGTTFAHVDVAKWLTRLNQVDAFTQPYLSLSQKGNIAETTVVNFNSSVQLSELAFRRNQQGAQRQT